MVTRAFKRFNNFGFISDSYNPKGPDPQPENEVLVKSDKKMMKDEMKQYRICEIVPNGSVFSGPLIGF